MTPHESTRRTGTALAAAAVALLAVAGCTNGTPPPSMMGGGSAYHLAKPVCAPPSSLPDTVVRVTLVDMGMSRMMGGVAPMGAHMRLLVSPGHVPAGKISLVAANRGWRTHELVVLPLAAGAVDGQRVPGPNGRIDETGSLGEASRSCGADGGEGITSGAVGWTTLTLKPGHYELVCNLRNHYADGMHQELVVS